MSLILDALRKSERSRQQTLTGQVSNAIHLQEHVRLPTPWVTLVGLILILNAIVLAFLLWRAEQPAQIQPVGHDVVPIAAASPVKPVIRPLAEEAVEPDVEVATPQTPAATTTSSTARLDAHSSATTMLSTDVTAAPLDTLPIAFQQSFPALHMDVHGYAGNPAARFVIINMRRYVAGDTLKEGPRVIVIIPQGVILEYHGTRFLLPRS